MPGTLTQIGPFTVGTFSLCLALGALATLAVAVRGWRNLPRGAVVDVLLGALIGAAVLGRLTHAALNWDYFSGHLDEIARLSAGGFDWHGAAVGGLIGLSVIARLHKLRVADLLDALTPALPLLAMTTWVGCWAAACGYGAEVDTLAHFSSLTAAEMPDVYGIVAPRFNTQTFGIALSALIFVIALGLTASSRFQGVRFWAILALLSLSMFALGYLRGDASPMVGGLRLDQWLDAGMIDLCAVMIAARVGPHPRPLSLRARGER